MKGKQGATACWTSAIGSIKCRSKIEVSTSTKEVPNIGNTTPPQPTERERERERESTERHNSAEERRDKREERREVKGDK